MSDLIPFKLLSAVACLDHSLEGWTLLDMAAEGARCFRQHVSFESAFARAPLVQVAIVGLDASNQDNLRLKVRAADITAQGFTLEVETWFNTRLWSVDASWLAIGE